ncbi:MAG: ABC-F family ATP-binding cassette domain-containing protein [Paracoccaceae bacterium]
MSLLNLNAISATRGEILFSGLNLTLNKGDRVGLIAANGRGKSTLLNILHGLHDASGGEITRARGLRTGLLAQDVPPELLALALYDAVLGALPAEQAEYESWRVDIALDDLGVPQDLRSLPMKALSGGWQRAGLLARLWVGEPDVLLLDEPTNHLDLGRIGQLQNWLNTVARGIPCIIASHDRAFLDAVTNRTLFLRADNSQMFALPFTKARGALTEVDATAARQFETDMKTARQLRQQAAKLNNIGINSGSDLLITKTKQLKARAEKIETAAKPAHAERAAGDIRLANSGTHAKALLALDKLDITTPDGRVLFNTGTLWINKGDRVVLLGANGAGKSRLLAQVLAAQQSAVAGLRMAGSVVLGVSDQQLSQLDRFATPMEAVVGAFDVGDQRARSLLAGAGIVLDRQTGPVAALSGGQKSRLAMLVLRLTRPNFYVLDEPTNHLDIEGQEALEAELTAQGAACLLVSHDRSFVRHVGSRFWVITGKKLIEAESPEPFFKAALAGQGG